MTVGANPFLGVFFHWLGGLASGSFYVPYRGVKKWAWETYWLAGGFFSWIIAPWVLAYIIVPHLGTILSGASGHTLFWSYFWGAMWGLGGLTFGLTMRYLGMSLGMAVALSYCSAFGTLMPPLFAGTIVEKFSSQSGLIILTGIVVCLLGIGVTGLAGMSKDREMPEAKKKEAIKEFSFWKGILVATFSGVMSASFAYGLAAGDPIKERMLQTNFTAAAEADGVKVQGPVAVSDADVQDLWGKLAQARQPVVEQMMTNIGSLKDGRLDALAAYLDRAKAPEAAAIIAALAEIQNPAAALVTAYCKDLGEIKADDLKAAEGTRKTVKELSTFNLKQLAMQIIKGGGKFVKYNDKFGLWQGLPVLIVVLLGGFTTNFVWCTILNIRNKTGREYFSSRKNNPPSRDQETIIETAIDAPSEEMVERAPRRAAAVAVALEGEKVPLLSNYFFSALAGTTWYMQFFFYSMGETQMGEYKFSSWTLHMASIIIFSTLWGIALKEWRGSSLRTHVLIAVGLLVLIASTIIVGYGNYLSTIVGG